jgi:hypothetical protein
MIPDCVSNFEEKSYRVQNGFVFGVLALTFIVVGLCTGNFGGGYLWRGLTGCFGLGFAFVIKSIITSTDGPQRVVALGLLAILGGVGVGAVGLGIDGVISGVTDNLNLLPFDFLPHGFPTIGTGVLSTAIIFSVFGMLIGLGFDEV